MEAARTLVERDGYVATTMEAVAAEAGMSLKTVYLAVTTKSGLLRAVWDLLLKGDPGDAPADRPMYRKMLEEKDPEKQLRMTAETRRLRTGRRLGEQGTTVASRRLLSRRRPEGHPWSVGRSRRRGRPQRRPAR